MFSRLIDRCCRGLDLLIAALLAVMVVLVFTNVVMRYAFNSGITISEELSRWLFVWSTFLGAVVALKDGRHLGTEMLIAHLPRRLRKLCQAVGYVLMLFACWLLFKGSLQQVIINWTTTSAVMEVSMSYFYAVGVACASLAGVILLRDLLRLFATPSARPAFDPAVGRGDAAHPDASH